MNEGIIYNRRSNLLFLVLLAFCVFFLIANPNWYIIGFKELIYYIIYPSSSIADRILRFGQNIPHNINEIVRSHQENIYLKEILKDYNLMKSNYEYLIEENNNLRKILGLVKDNKKDSVIANVIMREPENWFQWIIIDKGRSHGITLDDPVVTVSEKGFIALGRIFEVYEHSSKVVLITNILSATPAYAKNAQIDGLVEGQNTHILKFNYIFPEKPISVGDDILVSPLSSVFPAYTRIGTVHQIIQNSNKDSFQYLTVKSDAPLGFLRQVVVLISKQDR